ncbi:MULTISPECIES: DUF2304 domain-containing protein [Agromyces]|uniref:DUF2304 domain-containing protein n=1 Tax=Agromyces mediolanus TaxID=41986 RepID=A0A918FFA4_AGRME|nr:MULTISPECIES: DUF2304 domain-containing protein [Agromyces]GGR34531.1 hypothetical protein GCM10010196_30740 [Agromyces mediolanus]GLJ74124.1 hypothetical protein GCM10017583_33830 [Agromyces mediolanus]GLU90637.1 hypothetical protein Agsp01_28920 [Agromyces sp. NBRC 114283]
MSPVSYLFGVVAALAVFLLVVEMLRRRRLRERHALWWLIAGVLALVVGLFPGLLDWAAKLLGVGQPTNLVFFVSIAILVMICLQHSSELTVVENKTRTLAEHVAMQNERIQRLEAALDAAEDGRNGGRAEGAR